MVQPEGHPIKIIEQLQISPPPNSLPTSLSIPLTFFDIPGLAGVAAQRVTFYEFPDQHSLNPNFVQTVISSLKSSLCIALEKFYPFAAKIVVPPLPGKPRIIYDEGGTIPFTVAESTADLQELISNDPQEVKLLHPLLPILAPWRIEDDGGYTISPLLAIQVTLFPNYNSGMCIGVRFNHGVCDGRSFLHFIKSWASICRTGDHHIDPLPVLDRRIVEDPNDIRTTFLNAWWDSASYRAQASHIAFTPRSPTDQRATFIMPGATIARLKHWISNRSTILGLDPMNISSFAAACAFAWDCIVKSTSNDDDTNPNPNPKPKPQLCHFMFVADCRTLLETPLPETYFGNCLVPRLVAMERRVLVGPDGVVFGARAIAEEVKQVKNSGALKGVEKTMHEFTDKFSRFGRPLTVAGSPRLGEYDTDFGWGRPKKSVWVHIDGSGSIALEKSRDDDEGLEIGLVLSKAAMDAFTKLFNQLELSLI